MPSALGRTGISDHALQTVDADTAQCRAGSDNGRNEKLFPDDYGMPGSAGYRQ
jgi:hypothetical protein